MTLTYAPDASGLRPTDREVVMGDVARFVRRLRGRIGRFAALWVPERHADGVHLHAHLLLGRFVSKQVLSEAWGHGFVDVRLIRDQKGRCSARSAAGYATKYVTKELEAGEGRHAYEVTEGFQPAEGFMWADSFADAEHLAVVLWEGECPQLRWSSLDVEGWEGPEVRWWAWVDP